MKLATHLHLVLGLRMPRAVLQWWLSKHRVNFYCDSRLWSVLNLNSLRIPLKGCMEGTVFWAVTPCSMVRVYWGSRRTYCLLHGRIISEPTTKQQTAFCLLCLLFAPEGGGSAILRSASKLLPDYTVSFSRRENLGYNERWRGCFIRGRLELCLTFRTFFFAAFMETIFISYSALRTFTYKLEILADV
jgi:hypothetical protein